MEDGRLIRSESIEVTQKQSFTSSPFPTCPKPQALIREEAADLADDIQDLGRVSAALREAVALPSGEFIRADGQRGATGTETAL
jgi:hypothetical protein